MEESYLPHIKN